LMKPLGRGAVEICCCRAASGIKEQGTGIAIHRND
jgi:hypothetical protein